jgi:acetyl esterase
MGLMNRKYHLILCILFLLSSFANAQKVNLFTENDTITIKKFIYKTTRQGDLAIYIHYPKDWKPLDKRPAIVFFFGGGWRRGTVNQFKYQADYLASRGMITARADYRVKNRHGTLADKCVEDGKSTIRWLRANASRLGIDQNQIVASGGSAGGHVAACTLIINGFEEANEDLSVSSKPNLLILFNPVLDATASKRVNRMGSKEIARALSPNLFLHKDIPATLLFYGTGDSLIVHGQNYIHKAKHLGFDAILYMASDVGHGFFNKNPWLNKTLSLTEQFLEKHGYLHGNSTLSVSGKATMIRVSSSPF